MVNNKISLKDKIVDGNETTNGVTYIRHAHVYLAVKELKQKMKKKFQIVVDPEILYEIIDKVFGK